jgi:hypothetical protein
MNRATRPRHPEQLTRIADEIETFLFFSKRLAFQLFDAGIYYFGLWSLIKWLIK